MFSREKKRKTYLSGANVQTYYVRNNDRANQATDVQPILIIQCVRVCVCVCVCVCNATKRLSCSQGHIYKTYQNSNYMTTL